jgi:protein-tyrosine phosphatase
MCFGTSFNFQQLGPKFNIISLEADEADENCNLLKHFMACSRLIKQCTLKKENVIIVCKSGHSLSCTIILAFLIKEKGMTLNNAIQSILRVYPFCKPHPVLIYQLQLFQKAVRQTINLR